MAKKRTQPEEVAPEHEETKEMETSQTEETAPKSLKKQKNENSGSTVTKTEKHVDENRKNLNKKFNQIIQKDFDRTAKKKLIDEFLRSHDGKLLSICHKHDGSRVIQASLKFGEKDQRSKIVSELKEHVATLANSKYARFLVLKMLKYTPREYFAEMRGLLLKSRDKLIGMKEGIQILERLYTESTSNKEKKEIICSFYGKEFFILKKSQTLDQVIKENPGMRLAISQQLDKIVKKLIDKSMFEFTIGHRLIYDYFTLATSEEQKYIIEAINEESLKLMTSREGTLLIVHALAQGSAKDRKLIIKAMKGFVKDSAVHPYGYLAIVQALSTIDDTVLLNKVITSEVKAGLEDIITQNNGLKMLLCLLSSNNAKYLPKEDSEVLSSPQIHTYKKQATLRRKEVLQKIFKDIVETVPNHLEFLVKDKLGGSLICELIKCALTEDGEFYTEAAQTLINAIVEESKKEDAETKSTILDHLSYHRTVKTIVSTLSSHFKETEGESKQRERASEFSRAIFNILCQDISSMVKTRAVWILVAFLESVFSTKEDTAKVKKVVKAKQLSAEKKGDSLLKSILYG